MRGTCTVCGREKMLHFCPREIHCNDCEKLQQCHPMDEFRQDACNYTLTQIAIHGRDAEDPLRGLRELRELLGLPAHLDDYMAEQWEKEVRP